MSPEPVLLEPREVPLGGPRAMMVRRTLPHKQIRTVGAWCFVDHYGPDPHRMSVPPHPHMGLQTVTWLLSGEVEHRDSIGSLQRILPGQVNLMTAGHGICHSEYAVGPQVDMHGVQLWAALTDQHRAIAPSFEHRADLPTVRSANSTATVFVGEFAGERSRAAIYSPMVGAEVVLSGDSNWPLEPDFEYAVLALDDEVSVNGQAVGRGALQYLGWGGGGLQLGGVGRVMLLGGEPLTEDLLMWWNFVGRTHEEIVAAREEYQAKDSRFGVVAGDDAEQLPAPVMPTVALKPRPSRPVRR